VITLRYETTHKNKICSSEINNDNINQGVNSIEAITQCQLANEKIIYRRQARAMKEGNEL
jgi:hypothetical protein